MPETQDILFGVASQTLHHDVQEGQPSSVTSVEVFGWNIGDDGDAESATTGSASIDSVDTTFDDNAGVSSADPRVLPLAATTSVVKDILYLATNANGEKEWVDVQEIIPGVSVRARVPLYNDYVSGDTFKGTRISITVDTTWASDSGNLSDAVQYPGYRVRWKYVVGGVTYVATSYFDLVRYTANHGVTAAHIERLVPGFIEELPRAHQQDQAAGLITEAYRQFRIDLYQEQIPDEMIRDQDIVDEMVMRKTVVLWADQRALISGGSPEAADLAFARYQMRFDSIFKHPSEIKAPISDETGGGGMKTPLRITRR